MKTASAAIASTLAIALAFGTTVPTVARASNDKPCNTGGAAVGGAVLGALLGGKHHRAEGAAVGGAIGALACVAINYHAKQVKTAQQASQDYQNANGGKLPAHAAVVAYQTRLDPTGVVHLGVESDLDSDIEVAPGSDGVQPTIEEHLTMIGPLGADNSRTREFPPKNPSQGASAGEFQTQFSINLPKGVPDGQYQLKTALYVNGQDVRDTVVPMKVVKASM